uniref:Uncharacterized protein n=1 Tax=Avena sativa TaxID=4498 RepID=A0ACD5ZCX5_AVESA
MEAGGPGSGSKKRKPTAPLEKGAGGDRAPPPGAGEDEGGEDDRISSLPDGVLGEIVSLLPTKDGARTQVLASRWRHLWRSAPLNLDVGTLPTENLDHDVIQRILSAHLGPVRRFSVSAEHALSDATMEDWLRSPAFDNLQELEFCSWLPPPVVPPPASIFRFAATLRLAVIGTCHLSDDMVKGLHFPQLKHLALDEVIVSECALHGLVAGCPALECLLLHLVSRFCCVRINSLTLRSIGVLAHLGTVWLQGGTPRFEELVIEKAPCLERLFHIDLYDGLQGSVISAPKMETLCFLSNDNFSFDRIIQGLRADSLATMVCTVKVLAFNMSIFSLHMVIELMRCFPCLEKLYIQNDSGNVMGTGPKNCWLRKHRNPNIKCLDAHLKTIVLESYRGIVSEVNFVSFFVRNARVLESITIQVKTIDKEFIAKQQRLLQVKNKASRGARFHYTTDRCLRDIGDISNVRDLDLTDPFVR